MFTLVIGGSKSGKSGYAENLVMAYPERKIYLATMEPSGEEAHKAIERHRQMRQGKGFLTIEKYTSVGELVENEDIHGAVLLLECMGNLCANEMFTDGFQEDVTDKIVQDIETLSQKTKAFIVVSNIVGEDGVDYAKETKTYIKNMGMLNARIAMLADHVVEMVYGIPVVIK